MMRPAGGDRLRRAVARSATGGSTGPAGRQWPMAPGSRAVRMEVGGGGVVPFS
jgi:hypothetical protein